MARGAGSPIETILPIAKQYGVGAINWGLVAGKTQTYLPWDSWERPHVTTKPSVWFHDIFHRDGTLYRSYEGELIRKLTMSSTSNTKHELVPFSGARAVNIYPKADW